MKGYKKHLKVYEYNGEKHYWFGLFGNWWIGYYPVNQNSEFSGFDIIEFDFRLKKIANQIKKHQQFISKESCIVNLREAFKKRIREEKELKKQENKKRNALINKVWP